METHKQRLNIIQVLYNETEFRQYFHHYTQRKNCESFQVYYAIRPKFQKLSKHHKIDNEQMISLKRWYYSPNCLPHVFNKHRIDAPASLK